jgi:hypothetical protein
MADSPRTSPAPRHRRAIAPSRSLTAGVRSQRTATFALAKEGWDPDALSKHLCEQVCHYMTQTLVELYGGCIVVLKVS